MPHGSLHSPPRKFIPPIPNALKLKPSQQTRKVHAPFRVLIPAKWAQLFSICLSNANPQGKIISKETRLPASARAHRGGVAARRGLQALGGSGGGRKAPVPLVPRLRIGAMQGEPKGNQHPISSHTQFAKVETKHFRVPPAATTLQYLQTAYKLIIQEYNSLRFGQGTQSRRMASKGISIKGAHVRLLR